MRVVLLALVLVGCRGDQNATPPSDKWVEVKPPATELDHAQPARSPLARKLYGADVATDTLPLSIGIETIGGQRGVLDRRG